ncbi:hypothetical protein IF1G_05543 [Cordyceps javanica]|uniref:Uncharacterized protein n=1 Tax=Cordyceps javanica TaxID=43265 RepID=A0A545V1X7_9HYPO|nr:hypothetical protein IF1G_05543 [Cordyceps javanica]TQW07082.1 hypothetical protein IF2G_05466 [Cordyceps javanica]
MASQSSGDVEILVHVTAPSRVSDDATYRRLAQAYLSSAAGSWAQITTPSSPEPQQPPPSRQCDDNGGFAVPQSFCSDSQELSFMGALDNRHSPRVIVGETTRTTPPPLPQVLPDDNVTTPTTAVRQLPSQIADSYPMPDCDMFNITPTRVLQRYMGSRLLVPTPTAPPPISSPTLSSDGDCAKAKNVKAEVHAVDVGMPSSKSPTYPNGTQENRSQRQATIPATPLVLGPSRKRKALDDDDGHDTSALDVTHISSSIPSIPSSNASSIFAPPRLDSDPLPSNPLRGHAQDSGGVHIVCSAGNNTNKVHPHQDTPTLSSSLSYNALSQVPSTHPSASSSSSLSVRPPSPPVGVHHLDITSSVSAKLAKLADDLSSRYHPVVHRATALSPLERGHWRVDCRRWPPGQRDDAWAFLTSYILSGLAGWGVWCCRTADGHTIKLYGWAHVAKHTYLLLYLASGRHIKATGAQWYDADGVVAVEVVP